MNAAFMSYPLLATLVVGVEFFSWVATQTVVRLIRAMRVSVSLVGLLMVLTLWALVSLSLAMQWWSQSYGPVPGWALLVHGALCTYLGVKLVRRKDRGLGHLLDASLWIGWATATVICALCEWLS